MDWIEHIKQDENSALKRLYKDLRQPCIAWLKSNTNLQDEDVREVFQTSIVILYDNVRTGKLTELTANIQTYVLGICKNKAFEIYRKAKKTHLTSEMPTMEALGNEHIFYKTELEENIQKLDMGIDSLGDPCRSIIQLYYYKRMSMQEITSIMGYKNRDTTKNLKYKCLKRLQSTLKQHITVSNES